MDMKFLLGLLCFTKVSALLHLDVGEEWTTFVTKFNKTYESYAEQKYRLNIFMKNLELIEAHNMAADKGRYSYWLGINHMADWTDQEYEEKLLGLGLDVDLGSDGKDVSPKHNESLLSLPDEIDWRTTKCVTGVKYQGHCGSCYAFSTTGALETHHCLKTGELVSLSEQNIIDCTTNKKYGNKGCIGGLMDRAYRYVIENGGLDTEESYPYRAAVGPCRYRSDTVGATAVSYRDIRRGDEYELQKAVATAGPVSVGVDAREIGFKLYSYGIFDGAYCSSTKLNHGMLVTGYGVSEHGEEYWLIKNSWGTRWGDEGYIKLVRNHGNRCGIATIASYPVV